MTITELENTFWTITMDILGYDTSDKSLQNKVRIDWPTQGQPSFNVSEDVIFLKIVPIDDNYNRIRDMSWDKTDSTGNTLTETYTYTRVINVAWICYGPNSNTNAQTIRNKMFYDTFTDLLDGYSLYLIPSTSEPTRVPEEFNNLWWERTDLEMKFNNIVTDTVNVSSIGSVPININGTDYKEVT